MSIPLPDFLHAQAVKAKVDPDRIEELWERHCDWCDQHGKDYGGRLWTTLCERAANDEQTPVVRRDDPEVRRMRRLEREAKAAADEAYQREAVSLRTWLETTSLKPTTPLGKALAAYPWPDHREDPLPWLMEALKGVPAGRNRTCRCGRPVQSWVSNDVRYYAADCGECGVMWAKERKAER